MELGDQLNAFMAQAQAYFGQLNQEETYGWIAAAVGFVLFIVGLVLLIW